MEEFEELLAKLVNPETEGDTASVIDELRTYVATELGNRDTAIADGETAAGVAGETIAALEQSVLQVKADLADVIMKASSGDGSTDMDLDVDDEFDDEFDDSYADDDVSAFFAPKEK